MAEEEGKWVTCSSHPGMRREELGGRERAGLLQFAIMVRLTRSLNRANTSLVLFVRVGHVETHTLQATFARSNLPHSGIATSG